MKKTLSLLLAAILTFCSVFTCAAETETGDSFTTIDGPLEWIKAADDDACKLFILQNDDLFAMQPDARFTVYTCDRDSDPPTEAASGGAAQWTPAGFTDADGAEHTIWILPDMPSDAFYLRFEAGSFTDREGDLSPEVCTQYTFYASADMTIYTSELEDLIMTNTDADLIEGEAICYPKVYKSIPASYCSVRIENEDGVTFVTPEYSDWNDLFVPAAAGVAEYTLLVCGQQVGSSQVVSAISRAEYEALCKKERPLRVMLGIALIPTLPLFMLYGGAFGGVGSLAVSMAFVPAIFMLPLTVPVGSAMGFGGGVVWWWDTVTTLIFGAD